ncbi:MAG: Atg14 domain-containing protein [Desulfobacteraceae bacterium]|nr:Atg14 domain-containing protein [Desulfobacteraceae bacterium]
MNRYLLVALIFLAGVLGGCAAGEHDPRTGGFFGGIGGLGSGGYEKRMKEREASLEQLRTTQRALNIEKDQLEQQQSAAYVRLESDRARASIMQSEIALLDKKTKALATQQGTDQQRLAKLQQRLTALKGQMGRQSSALDALEGSGLGDADVDLRRKQLEKQRDALAREYELLMKMQLELSQ